MASERTTSNTSSSSADTSSSSSLLPQNTLVIFILIFISLFSFQYILILLFSPVNACLLTIALTILVAKSLHAAGILVLQPASRRQPALQWEEDYLKDVKIGRWTAQPGLVAKRAREEEEGNGVEKGTGTEMKPAQEGVVCFVLGASANHPLLENAPGFEQLGTFFNDMWKDAEKRREHWGFLGRSTGLSAHKPTSITIASLSYWKSVDGLRAFAASPAHREGWNWWNSIVHEHPHLGIMHEVYAAPPGSWENISVNFAPFGMGETESIIKTANGTEQQQQQLKSNLIEASQPEWRSMMGRMNRKVEVEE